MKKAPSVLSYSFLIVAFLGFGFHAEASSSRLQWDSLPDLPADLGVAGAFVGTHNGALIVAGGANFPEPVWENPKVYKDDTWILTRNSSGEYSWFQGPRLSKKAAYGAAVSTPFGVLCMGGTDGISVFPECFLLSWDSAESRLTERPMPAMPGPNAFGDSAIIDEVIYLAGGQSGLDLSSSRSNFWRIDLSRSGASLEDLEWETLPGWPGPDRAYNITVAQHNGFSNCIYVFSGRCVNNPESLAGVTGFTANADIFALQDVYEFNPDQYEAWAVGNGTVSSSSGWRKRNHIPFPVMAGTGISIGQSHIYVLSGADGTLISKANELKEAHPGFPKRTLAYHTITDTWIESGPSPANQVSTKAVWWNDQVVLASGELKPRVRTRSIWSVKPTALPRDFGGVNYTVLAAYLALMVGIGIFFTRRNQDVNQYFRGGQKVAWWLAGCSIFATMLSSITYMAIPAKAFAQDWVYLVGNLMILAVAPIAVFIALPFFRKIDATSAYEYLQKRFNLTVRLYASLSFTIFHIFRMGIVMSLAGLALATVTRLSASQCVLIMGGLSVLYCTLGGVTAVLWTDTIQTVVLLGGAFICIGIIINDLGMDALSTDALNQSKLHLFNLHWDPTSLNLALWVVIFGAIGQNLVSYTADQAVVQRYMTTPDQQRAARSIWLAALLAVPASILFFGIGTALFVYYRTYPERLDPTFLTDQIFPLFIANEVPVGLAGLIVAGIFAAAQSTISTSMNSTASTAVSDFLNPFWHSRSERQYLKWARVFTLISGVLGTFLGLYFISPENRSLFDSFIQVIGLAMGVLGGLFALGLLTERVSASCALTGAVLGTATTVLIAAFTEISGYLYSAIGITSCFLFGYIFSFLFPGQRRDIRGLTVFSLKSVKPPK